MGQVYQLRIQLSGISPPIWRRILVAADCTIAELHQTIQLAMGWTDEHLHRFTIPGQWFGVPHEGGLHFFAGTHRLRLAEFDFRAHESFRYEYDFHSDWVHDIRVEKILPRASMRHVPVCLAGVGRCPEDSGPPDRFMATLDEHSGFDFMTWLEDESLSAKHGVTVLTIWRAGMINALLMSIIPNRHRLFQDTVLIEGLRHHET